MDDKNEQKPGALEASAPATRAPHAGGAETGPGRGFSSKRKLDVVQRLMRGDSREALSRELNVPAHRLSEWRDRVLVVAESALKERERDECND